MSDIANTPEPPYYAVIFSTLRTDVDNGYGAMADHMFELAKLQPGFLGMESVRESDGLGITVSYWRDLESIRAWREHGEHRIAQTRGRAEWYQQFKTRICRVERDNSFVRH